MAQFTSADALEQGKIVLEGMLIGAIVGGLIVVIGAVIGMSRKVSAKTIEQARRRLTLSSALSPGAVFQKLEGAGWRRLKLADSDPGRRVLVLATPMSVFSWGFFYPVFVHASASGSTVEVGIKSRVFQWGPVVTNNHKACLAEVEQALSA